MNHWVVTWWTWQARLWQTVGPSSYPLGLCNPCSSTAPTYPPTFSSVWRPWNKIYLHITHIYIHLIAFDIRSNVYAVNKQSCLFIHTQYVSRYQGMNRTRPKEVYCSKPPLPDGIDNRIPASFGYINTHTESDLHRPQTPVEGWIFAWNGGPMCK